MTAGCDLSGRLFLSSRLHTRSCFPAVSTAVFCSSHHSSSVGTLCLGRLGS